ncbi:hypothetical protein Y032_0040g272 [Ancylostoma ceylanicum]|uniref:Uncharacterized protein n=1 Tax=Ancylostoma ceylanicum TaxID=53326 RepID=A0A016UI70_9BILA|nr:hypothetical protein Y032_0040g272 [Ancylostoma ceylanicum]
MTDNPLGNENLSRAENSGRQGKGDEENRHGNGADTEVVPASAETEQRQFRLLTRIKRDMRTLLERIDHNASLLDDIVNRLEVIERKLDDFLESMRNLEDNTSRFRPNGIDENH